MLNDYITFLTTILFCIFIHLNCLQDIGCDCILFIKQIGQFLLNGTNQFKTRTTNRTNTSATLEAGPAYASGVPIINLS
jgi:hypothetical protein